MKKTLLILVALLFQLNSFAQYTAIPDVNFETALIALGLDSGSIDHKVLTANINTITLLDVSSRSIVDLTGIQDFVALKNLYCVGNKLTSLDMSGLKDLITLNCSSNQLTSLNVSVLTALVNLYCESNQLTSLNLSGLTALTNLWCANNQLTSLNVSGLKSIVSLVCYFNKLTSLNVSGLTALKKLDCNTNQLTSLNVSELTILTSLGCSSNKLANLNVSGCTALITLECYTNQLTSLNVSGLPALTNLWCANNQLTSLNVSGLTALTNFWCSLNQLTTLNLSGLTALTSMTCTVNPLLLCIQVDDIAAAMAKDLWAKDATASYSLNCGLATRSYDFANGIAVFPNPTQAILNLPFETIIDNIIITDLTGKTVLHQTLPSSQINVQNLAKGMYILQAFSGKEKYTTKFVKE